MRTLQYLLIGSLLAGTGITGCGAVNHDADHRAPAVALGAPRPPASVDAPSPRPAGSRTDAGGRIPDGVYRSAFDTRSAAVALLDPRLRESLQKATQRARVDGVRLGINSGWRSRSYQQRLLDDAVSRYGSLGAALHWVALPDESHHVTGDAVDIGPSAAAGWLEANGSSFGLCRLYENEPWHFELRRQALDGGPCPPMYPDDSYDPDLRGGLTVEEPLAP